MAFFTGRANIITAIRCKHTFPHDPIVYTSEKPCNHSFKNSGQKCWKTLNLRHFLKHQKSTDPKTLRSRNRCFRAPSGARTKWTFKKPHRKGVCASSSSECMQKCMQDFEKSVQNVHSGFILTSNFLSILGLWNKEYQLEFSTPPPVGCCFLVCRAWH